jgi:methionyl-tRNA formyltransferase
VDWTQDAVTVWNRQRAVTPWPGATTGIQGKRLQILAARPLDLLAHDAAPGSVLEIGRDGVTIACGTGAITLRSVKPEGRQVMTAAEWARGARIKAGDMLHIEKEAHA